MTAAMPSAAARMPRVCHSPPGTAPAAIPSRAVPRAHQGSGGARRAPRAHLDPHPAAAAAAAPLAAAGKGSAWGGRNLGRAPWSREAESDRGGRGASGHSAFWHGRVGHRRVGRSGVVAATRFPVDLPPIPRSFPPLSDPVLPAFQKVTLANGLRVILLEDPEMGLVEGQLCVRGGAKLEPATQVGLASVLSSVQRSGGTALLPEERLDDLLEDLAASVETGSTSAEMDVGFQCLPGDLPTALDVFAQVTLSPLLPASKLELVRSQALGSLARRNDNPGRVAGRKMRELLYGRESPYGRTASAQGLSSIALQDLRSFHSLSFCDPSQAVLGVWGDIDPSQVLDLVDRHLGPRAWSRGFRLQAAERPAGRGGEGRPLLSPASHAQPLGGSAGAPRAGVPTGIPSAATPTPTALGSPSALLGAQAMGEVALGGVGGGAEGGSAGGVSRQPGGVPVPAECDLGARARAEGVGVEEGYAAAPLGFYGFDVPGLTQGYVRLGELGTTFEDDDVFALDVLNSILNGFGGRLFDKIRSQQGLAYSVSGSWSPSLEHRGTFVAGGETQIGNIFKFVAALTESLYQATLEAPTEDELQRAKDAALNSFVFNFSSTGAQMQRILSYELYGIPQDFPFQYRERVEALTQDDILQAAQRWLHPEEQRLLVVSDFSQLRPELSAYGLQVQMLDLDD